jgi:hypothetical protein
MAVTWTARTIGLVSSLVRTIASVIGGLILVHAVFVLFGANPSNVLVQFTAGIRDSFGWFTKNLFQPSDHKMGEAINDALAGFIWVFLGSLLAKFIARLAPASSGKDKSSKKNDTPRSTPVQKSKAAEQPKQEVAEEEAPKQEPPKQEPPKQEAVREEAPKEKVAEDDLPRYDEPKDEAPRERPEPEPEPESEAKHAARRTARDDERAEDKAQA